MLNSNGVTLKQLGEMESARIQLAEALAWHRQTGQKRLEAHALGALGDLCHDTGAREEAVRYYMEIALEINPAMFR